MNCNKCGCPLSENQAVCPACGAPQMAHTAAQQPTYSNAPPIQPSYYAPATNPVPQVTVPLSLLQVPSIILIIYGALMTISRVIFFFQHITLLRMLADAADSKITIIYKGFIASDFFQFVAAIFIIISAASMLKAKRQYAIGQDAVPKMKSAFKLSIVYGGLTVFSNFITLVCSQIAAMENNPLFNLITLLISAALSAFICAYMGCMIPKRQPAYQNHLQ